MEKVIEPRLPKACKITFSLVGLDNSDSAFAAFAVELPEDPQLEEAAVGESDNSPAYPPSLGDGSVEIDPLDTSPSPIFLPPLARLASPNKRSKKVKRRKLASPLTDESPQYEYKEVVVDRDGQPRQAGADSAEGEFIREFRLAAEKSLFIFLKGVLNRHFLTSHFHQDICNFAQTCPPFRKLILMARSHAKTAIVSGGLPIHILVQPAEGNIYFPGIEGSECRILLAGETETMAKKNLRVIKTIFDENKTFRALWPHRCWEGGGRKKKEWSTESIIIPRKNEWPDPTIRAVGVGGAITGARPNVLIEDDLVSFKAMNSEVVMQEAIEWHTTARALLDTYEVESGLQSLQFVIGTRWAVHDLYSYIIDNDKTVEVNDRKYHQIITDGKILWPEKYTLEDIEQLKLEHGSMFYLLYLNRADDPSLTDFDITSVRKFRILNGMIVFEEEERDLFLEKKMGKIRGEGEGAPARVMKRGEPIDLLRLAENIKGGMGCRLRR